MDADSVKTIIIDAVTTAIKNNCPPQNKQPNIIWTILTVTLLIVILIIIMGLLSYIVKFFNSTDNCFKVSTCPSTTTTPTTLPPASSAFRARQLTTNHNSDDSVYYDKIAHFLNNQKYINYVEYKNFLEYNNITNEKLYDTKFYMHMYELRPNVDKNMIQSSI